MIKKFVQNQRLNDNTFIVFSCDDPGIPLHGRYRAKVWFSCHSYTTLVGIQTITCNEHGRLSSPRPLCRSSCPSIQSVKDGLMVGGKKIGEKMWFICRLGYIMIGPSSIWCQPNATWSDDPPICVSGCTKPPVITNGHANATFATVGHSIGYSCDSCYEMEGPADITCLPNNTWSQSLPQFKLSGCTNPPVITNGRANATFATVSHSVGYSCDSCYEMEGPADVTCLPNNTWSQPLLQCKRITCDNPMDTVSPKRDHEFYCGAEMIFECAEGFKMVGSSSLKCLETGNWSNYMPICEYSPEIGNCSELLPPLNGSIAYSINDTFVIAEYLCKTGFSLLDGDVERFCDEAGVWTGTEPICVDDDSNKCPFLDAPTNAFVVIRGFRHGDNASYFCIADYIVMSGDHVRQCMTNGQWSREAPTCQKVEPMCQEPRDLLNARYTVSMPVSTTTDSDQLHHNVVVMGGTNRNASNVTDTEETALMFLLGGVARYFCDNGYEMTGGDSTLMCFSNGSWIGDIGNCERLKCPQPKEHENSFVLDTGLTIGSTATYHCYGGFFPDMNSSMTITCQETGTWTELVGRCSPAVCEYPEVKDDVIVSGKNFAYASEGIRLKCASSQARLTRRNTRSKCLADLSWSVKNFTCSNGLCPVNIGFDVCNSTDFCEHSVFYWDSAVS